jgi:hypothetical protein
MEWGTRAGGVYWAKMVELGRDTPPCHDKTVSRMGHPGLWEHELQLRRFCASRRKTAGVGGMDGARGLRRRQSHISEERCGAPDFVGGVGIYT